MSRLYKRQYLRADMNISNENKLLLCCARTRISENTLNEIKSIISLPLNWEEVLRSASWHGIAPLLYHNLKNIAGIPQEVMDQLKKAYYGNMARNMYLYTELRRILEGFGERGVDVIVLKGVALAQSIYGDIALRPMGDIDLLVRKEDLPYAERIMSTLNYSTYMNGNSQEWYRHHHFHLPPYIATDKSMVVEIHHNIIDRPFHIDIGKWWERAREGKIANCNVLIPSAEDMVVHLCVHLFNHGYNKSLLRGLCDISETLRHYGDGLNWIQFQDEVSRYGINRPVYSILYLVNKLYRVNSKLPELLKSPEAAIDSRVVSVIEKQIFTEDEISPNVPGPLIQFLVTDKFVDKIRILLATIFPTREVMSNWYSIPLSSKKLYLYYLARPFRLFLKYRKSILEISSMKRDSI
ncbi:MAG: nucleotidyltransferase family protein [Ignavibacteriales bacterium]